MGRRLWAAVLVAALACALGRANAEVYPGVAAVAQNGFPIPPMQQAPWTPPDGGPGDVLVTATRALFELGFPDPRGCTYSEITVIRLQLRGEAERMQTHGWALPRGRKPQQFAICWDGLIYPVLEVGKPADLKADVEAALSHEDEAKRERGAGAPGRQSAVAWNWDRTYDALETDQVLPLRACLLLRLGEADLAGRMWQRVVRDFEFGTAPYMPLAVEWAWTKYARAVTYHCRGIHPLALAELRSLDELEQQLLLEAVRRGLEAFPQSFAFLVEVPDLLADEDRRGSVNELIRDLEDVSLEMYGAPGSFEYSDSPTMVQLVLAGEPAVTPLLNAMENERRLSRTAEWGRPWWRDWRVVTVKELERTAVCAILGGPPLSDADSLRKWWDANKDRRPAERWYATLADDNAGPDMWRWAAAQIVRPDDEPLAPLDLLSAWRAESGLTTPPGWAGEPLRDGRRPSVSDLMARRAMAMTAQPGLAAWNLPRATSLAGLLARWDPQAAREPLRAMDRSWHELADRIGTASSLWESGWARALADLALARLYAGDDQALADYAAWVQGGYTRDTRLLWLAPEDPVVVSTTQWLAEHMEPARMEDPFSEDLAPSGPMLAVEPFRAYVLRELRNMEPVGYILVQKGGGIETAFRDWIGPHLVDHPPEGTKVTVRACDSLAWNLSYLPGFPKFDPFAPVEERDRAAAECARMIEEKGASVREKIDADAFWARWLRGGQPYAEPTPAPVTAR